MSRQPVVVLSDSEEVAPLGDVEPFKSWRDLPAHNAVLKACQPCLTHGRKQVPLANGAKAINHWAADGTGKKDISATIKDCLCVCKVPGLMEYARKEVKKKVRIREDKEACVRQQLEKDSARASPRDSQSRATMASGASLPGSGEGSVSKRRRTGDIGDTLTFNNEWVSKVDRAIANLVVRRPPLSPSRISLPSRS